MHLSFGTELRATRLAAQLTTDDLGELVGVDSTCVSGWERSIYKPSRQSFRRLREVFGQLSEPEIVAQRKRGPRGRRDLTIASRAIGAHDNFGAAWE